MKVCSNYIMYIADVCDLEIECLDDAVISLSTTEFTTKLNNPMPIIFSNIFLSI